MLVISWTPMLSPARNNSGDKPDGPEALFLHCFQCPGNILFCDFLNGTFYFIPFVKLIWIFFIQKLLKIFSSSFLDLRFFCQDVTTAIFSELCSGYILFISLHLFCSFKQFQLSLLCIYVLPPFIPSSCFCSSISFFCCLWFFFISSLSFS